MNTAMEAKNMSTPIGRRPLRTVLALGSALLLLLAACTQPTSQRVLSVTIDPSELTLEVGENAQLSVTVEVTGGANRLVEWSSADEAVATVSVAGQVAAVAPGSTTITATSRADSSVSDTITITVEEASVGSVTSVVINQDDFSIAVGDSVTLTAAVEADGGASTDVDWASSDEGVASVDAATGEVTGVAAGTAVITATSAFDASVSDSVTVTVSTDSVDAVLSVVIDQTSQNLEVGDTLQLTATVTAVGAASEEVTWTSDNAAVASVDAAGLVTAVAEGTASITATSVFDATRSDSITITVTVAGTPTVVSVTIEQGDQALAIGSTVPLTVDVVVANGADDGVEWTTNNAAVATVGAESGVVTAVAAGTAVITATSTFDDTVSDSITVTVTAAPEITSFSAQVVSGSQIEFSWAATNATSFDIFGVDSADGTVELATGLTGDTTTATVAIPASTHQTLRLVARSGAATDESTIAPLATIVTVNDDFDPYDAQGMTPEPAIPGTLRQIMDAAPAGAVIGFASDIGPVVTVTGVRVVTSLGDAHIFIDKDVTISGPPTGLTIQGASGWEAGDPGDPYTYRSRVVYVAPDTTARLENLTLTGGDFIFLGGGVRNDGDLTMVNVNVTGNRAWTMGGGVYNTGTLTIEDSTISDNQAFTTDEEVGETFAIRGGFVIGPFGAEGYGGGVYNTNGGSVNITDSVISGNRTRFSGGGVANSAAFVAVDTAITNNIADFTQFDPVAGSFSYGGGVINEGTFTFSGANVADNFAEDQGGGLWQSAPAQGAFTDTTFLENEAEFGGAIRHLYCAGTLPAASLQLTNVQLVDNVTTTGDDHNTDTVVCDGPDGVGPASVDRILPSREAIRDFETR